MKKVIIAGSREFNDYLFLKEKIEEIYPDKDIEVVCGYAFGADSIGWMWGKKNKRPIVIFKANWGEYGKSAGYKRNLEMGEYADEAVVFWDGESRGSKHMIDIMKKLGKPVRVVRYNDSKDSDS